MRDVKPSFLIDEETELVVYNQTPKEWELEDPMPKDLGNWIIVTGTVEVPN